MKKITILLFSIMAMFLFIACNNSLDLDYQNNIIIGKNLASPDSTLLGEVSNSFIKGITLYFRVTTKEELKSDPVNLIIQKVSDGSNKVVFNQNKWFQSPDFHACTFAVSKLDTGKYKAILKKGVETDPLTTRDFTIYLND